MALVGQLCSVEPQLGQLGLTPAWLICPQLELDAFPDLLALVDVLGNDCGIRESSQKEMKR